MFRGGVEAVMRESGLERAFNIMTQGAKISCAKCRKPIQRFNGFADSKLCCGSAKVLGDSQPSSI